MLLELRATADAVMAGACTVDLMAVNLGPGLAAYRRKRVRRGLATGTEVMEVNYLEVEEKIRATYRHITAQYRRDDEIEVRTANHRRLCRLLGSISRSFAHPIRALDVGCGTGRYFHCLESVSDLTGLDVSNEMLTAAREPVLSELVTARHINLLRGNAYLVNFPPGSFDFIYSLGMFGQGCPVNVEICTRLYQWLAPGGKLLFNTVDFAGLPLKDQALKRIRSIVYPALTKPLKRKLDSRKRRSPWFGMSRRALVRVLNQSPFRDFQVTSHACESPLWQGRHLQCLASKSARAD
jgi:SAM-dependent methyltransferase